MPEAYTEIKLVWKYGGNYFEHCDSWLLMMDGTKKIAWLRRHDDEILQRANGLHRFAFLFNVQYKDVFPWVTLDEGLDKEALFRLSDSGVTTAEMDDVYDPDFPVRLLRQPDGSFERASDLVEDHT